MQIDCIIGYGTPIYEAQLNDYVTLASLRSFSSFVGADFDDIVHEMGHDPETVQEGDFTPVEFLTAINEKGLFDAQSERVPIRLLWNGNEVYFYVPAIIPWDEREPNLPHSFIEARRRLFSLLCVLFGENGSDMPFLDYRTKEAYGECIFGNE